MVLIFVLPLVFLPLRVIAVLNLPFGQADSPAGTALAKFCLVYASFYIRNTRVSTDELIGTSHAGGIAFNTNILGREKC